MNALLENVSNRLKGIGFICSQEVFLCQDKYGLFGLEHAPRDVQWSEGRSPSSHTALWLTVFALFSPEAHAKQGLLLFYPTVQPCDVGLSKSPHSAGQCFKGSGSCFPSQEPASKLESSVVWFGFHSSLQSTGSAKLYIHVRINSNRCTFNMENSP